MTSPPPPTTARPWTPPAAAVADAVLDDQRVVEVTVAVRKVSPPVPYEVTSTGVRIHRGRSDRIPDGSHRGDR
jgi:hypothetical protein